MFKEPSDCLTPLPQLFSSLHTSYLLFLTSCLPEIHHLINTAHPLPCSLKTDQPMHPRDSLEKQDRNIAERKSKKTLLQYQKIKKDFILPFLNQHYDHQLTQAFSTFSYLLLLLCHQQFLLMTSHTSKQSGHHLQLILQNQRYICTCHLLCWK